MRLPLAIATLMLLVHPAMAQPQDPPPRTSHAEISAYLEPKEGIFVGQLVRLWLEIKSTGRFIRSPRYPDLDIDGAIAIMPEQLGVNFSEGRGDDTMIGQRQRYVIIPQRSGEFTVSALTIAVTIADENEQPKEIELRTKPVSMSVTMPPGAENLASIVTVQKIAVDQRYDGISDTLKAGDAVTRTITMSAEGTLALALPKIVFSEPDGAQVYPAKTIFEDKINRGTYRAKRTDAATYVFSRAGEFSLPPITVTWFDPETKTLKSEELPGKNFSVEPDPLASSTPETKTPEKSTSSQISSLIVTMLEWLRTNIVSLTLACIALYLAALIWRRYAAAAMNAVRSFISKILNSEPFYFLKFRQACTKGDTDEVIKAFWRWLDCLTPENRAATVQFLSRQSKQNDPLKPTRDWQQDRYHDALLKTSATTDTREIFRIVSSFRDKVLQARRVTNVPDKVELNPRSLTTADTPT
jgi:hypothetical protein